MCGLYCYTIVVVACGTSLLQSKWAGSVYVNWAESMTIDTIFRKVTFNFIQLFLDFDGKEEHSKQILRFRKVKYSKFLVLIDSSLAFLLMREIVSQ